MALRVASLVHKRPAARTRRVAPCGCIWTRACLYEVAGLDAPVVWECSIWHTGSMHGGWKRLLLLLGWGLCHIAEDLDVRVSGSLARTRWRSLEPGRQGLWIPAPSGQQTRTKRVLRHLHACSQPGAPAVSTLFLTLQYTTKAQAPVFLASELRPVCYSTSIQDKALGRLEPCLRDFCRLTPAAWLRYFRKMPCTAVPLHTYRVAGMIRVAK